MEAAIGRSKFRQEKKMSSPDRSKLSAQQRGRIVRPSFRKLQVIYYLSRNGQLEHPHYIEVTHLNNQPLRLKDVFDRLTFLRGKGMHSLYSWSCKRSYKNGYVWYDLAENDEIYPSHGAEYVLKGSELLEDVDNPQKFQPGNHEPKRNIISTKQHSPQPGNINQQKFQPGNHEPKRNIISTKQHSPQPGNINQLYIEEDEEHDEEYDAKNGYTTSTTPHSRCSIGGATEEIPPPPQPPHTPSPPSTTSSSTPSDKASRVFEEPDTVATRPLLSRNSVLLHLISCGGSTSFRGTKHVQKEEVRPTTVATRKSNSSGGNQLHKGVLCKAAAEKVELEAEERAEIMCMSENPRFGNAGIEEREYFSGTIVEEIATKERVIVEPTLKKSSSYNEERSCKVEFGEVAEDEVKTEKTLKAKCMPRLNCSGRQYKQ